MKKYVFASVMALASLSLVAPNLRAQDLSIKDPAEFNAYQMATTQGDPKAKAAALESFLKNYPQSIAKNTALQQMMEAYQQANDTDNVVSAASRLLQVDPNNFEAIYLSVLIKKAQCGKTTDPQTCDDAAALAQKGLQAPRAAGMADPDWQKLTHGAYPIFHSAIALDDAISKKDWKAAQDEYTAELKMFDDNESKSVGLSDTLFLAQAYSQPGSTQDLVKAVWFYARVWDYAPDKFKAQIGPKLDYYYKKYHGKLDGLDDIKQQAQATTFPPSTLHIDPAKSPAEQIHDLLASTDPSTLALADKETVLAMGSKEDADKLWALVQGKETQVPGIVIAATADQIQVAVTQDAKDTKVADFIVNLKKPLTDAEQKVVVPGFEFKTQPAAELVGTYDTYQQVAATDKTSQAASIVLKDGEYVPEEKKKATKPPAAHHAPVHHTTAH